MLTKIYSCGKCKKQIIASRWNAESPLNVNHLKFDIDDVRYEVDTELCDECQKVYNIRMKAFLEDIKREFRLYEE